MCNAIASNDTGEGIGFRFLPIIASGKFPIRLCLFHLLLIPITDRGLNLRTIN